VTRSYSGKLFIGVASVKKIPRASVWSSEMLRTIHPGACLSTGCREPRSCNVEQMEAFRQGGVSGYLHRADGEPVAGLVAVHGAGSNAGAPLLRIIAEVFAANGFTVLRCDLPFRQARPKGPPRPGDAARDREGLLEALDAMRGLAGGPVYAGGVSYGGRQASMLAAEKPGCAAGLLLLSYPLHAPGKPHQRTEHFPKIACPALFVHGSRDPFGSPEELKAALQAIPVTTVLRIIEGAGHDLKGGVFDASSLPKELLAISNQLKDRPLNEANEK